MDVLRQAENDESQLLPSGTLETINLDEPPILKMKNQLSHKEKSK